MTGYDVPLFRLGDPDTSRDAATSMAPALAADQQLILATLRRLHQWAGHGATAAEIVATLLPVIRQQNCVARRLTDLRDGGLVEDRGDRRPGTTGRNQIVWYPTCSATVVAK